MMTSLSSFTGRFRLQNNQLHNASSTKVTKSPRRVHVCIQCRRAKTRCDRAQPCSSCSGKSEGGLCSYPRSAGPKAKNPRQELAEDRLLRLESAIKDLIHCQSLGSSSGDSIPSTAEAQTEDCYGLDILEIANESRSKWGDSTAYIGATHWSTILNDIHELRKVIGDSVEVFAAEIASTTRAAPAAKDPIFGSMPGRTVQKVVSECLPSRMEVDRLLSTYFRGETFMIPFVHTYQFQRQYREFCADETKVNPLWMSMLFSVCYMGCLTGGETATYHLARDESVVSHTTLHMAAGQCLVLGEYHLPQKYSCEALALYAQCKNLSGLDPSREAGAILGMAIRKAYEMGYHRDSASFGSFTAFEGEMRRRCWAVCKQMDFMITFQLGLPSNIRLEDCDTQSPRHILDSDFDEMTQVLPLPRPENEPTKLLWFVVKDRHMINFSKVNQGMLSTRDQLEAEVLQLDKDIRQIRTTIPLSLQARPLSESITDEPFIIMTRIFIEFMHLKSLCVLHRRYMIRGDPASTRSCVDAAKKMVSMFIDMYKEFAPGGQLYSTRWMLTSFTMNDYLLGVMILCLFVHTRQRNASQMSTDRSVEDIEIIAMLQQSHTICVEKSSKSRDARRVSFAIKLTLDGSTSTRVPKESVFRSPSTETTEPSMTEETSTVDGASILLSPQQNESQVDEAVFGVLDPFNFIGSEVEHIDWAAFDQWTWNPEQMQV